VFPKVEIHLARAFGEQGNVTYYALELKQARITNYTLEGPDTEQRSVAAEELSLSFAELRVVYTELDRLGAPKSTVEYSFKR
jgi:type VI protein secretion system component Hcp